MWIWVLPLLLKITMLMGLFSDFQSNLKATHYLTHYLDLSVPFSPALGLETQIHVQALGTEGLMVDCNSGGWIPKPQMECRDSRGEIVAHSSKSYSQDGARLFHMKMTLVLRNQSWGNMTCYICNPLTGEEKWINIILAGECLLEFCCQYINIKKN